MSPSLAILATASVFVCACVARDIRVRRIPNALTLAGIVIGFTLNGALFGVPGVMSSAAGLLVSVALLLFPFALGGIGGGDVKMMGAVGAILGPKLALISLACGLGLGGLIMLAHLARLGRVKEKLGATRDMVLGALVQRSTKPLELSAADPAAVALPYSVPLGIGTVAVLLWAHGIGGLT